MLLLSLDIDGTTRRVSNDELPLEHSWYAEVNQPPTVKHASSKLYGGIFSPSFGSVGFVRTTFLESTWPPPKKIGGIAQWTASDEASALSLFSASLYRSSNMRTGVTYNISKPDSTATVDDVTWSGSLTSVFAAQCVTLGRTLDISGTSRNPDVLYEIKSEKLIIAGLSEIAAFFCHAFTDDGATITLYDCLQAQGELTLDEFDFFPPTYLGQDPVSNFEAGDYSVAGSNAGEPAFSVSPVCHTTQANIEAALANIKTIVEREGASIPMPMTEKTMAIVPGMKLIWSDETIGVDAWILVQSINYDFAAIVPTITATGKGVIA